MAGGSIHAMTTWHPRQNAYRTGPVSWELRNGLHAAPYATVERVHGRFILCDEIGREIGSYATGDEAAEVAWELACAPRSTAEETRVLRHNTSHTALERTKSPATTSEEG